MTQLEDSPHFSLWHDASCACLYATWRGRHGGSLTQVQYGLIRWHLQATGSTRLLNDSLLDEDGWQEIICWLADNCFHTLVAEGLRAVAWVLPRHPGGLCDTMEVLGRLQQLQPALVDTFDDVESAHAWLTRLPAAASSLLPTTVAAFAALPQAQQLALVEQHGQALVPWWEADFYVKAYLIGSRLRIEVAYHLHSGLFYRVRAYTVPRW